MKNTYTMDAKDYNLKHDLFVFEQILVKHYL